MGREGACGSGRLRKMSTSPALRDAHLALDAAQDLAAGSPAPGLPWLTEDIEAGPRRSARPNFGRGRPSSPASARGEPRGRKKNKALAVASHATDSASPSDSQAAVSASPRSACAKMPDMETIKSYLSIRPPLTQSEAAGQIGCSLRTLVRACRNFQIQWPHKFSYKFTEEDARCIFKEGAQGGNPQEIADQYGISSTTVWNIWRKKTWRHATRHVFKSTLCIVLI